MGKEGEGSSRNMYKGPMDKAKGGKDGRWEVVVGSVGKSGGGKMETTVLEPQLKNATTKINTFKKEIKRHSN